MERPAAFAYIIGYLISDGSISREVTGTYYARLCVKQGYELATLESRLKDASIPYTLTPKPHHVCSNGDIIRILRLGVKNSSWLRRIYQDGKSIPVFIIEGTEEIKASFLAGCWDADGDICKYLNKGYPECNIEFNTMEKERSSIIVLILQTLGISSSVYPRAPTGKGKSVVYRVHVHSGPSRKRFIELIAPLMNPAKTKNIVER